MRISNLHDLMRVRNYHFLTQTTKLQQLWWFDEKLINSLFDWPGWCSSSPWCWWLAPGTSPWCCGGGILTSLRLLQLRHGTSWQPPQPRLQGGEDRSPTQLSWLRMDTLERVTHFRDKILLRVSHSCITDDKMFIPRCQYSQTSCFCENSSVFFLIRFSRQQWLALVRIKLDTWSATVKYFWQSSASSVSGVQVTAGTDLWSPAGLVWVKSSAILLPAHSPPPATQPSIPRSTMFPRPDTRTLWPELSWAHSEPGPTSWHSSPVSHPIGSAWGANVCILTTIQCVLASHHLPANHSSFSSPTLSILWFPFYFKIWNIFPTIVWQAHASKHLLVVVEACWIICERLPSLTAVSVSTISACITSSVPASLLELCHKIIKNFV